MKCECYTLVVWLWSVVLFSAARRLAANPAGALLNEPVDISGDFRDFTNTYNKAVAEIIRK